MLCDNKEDPAVMTNLLLAFGLNWVAWWIVGRKGLAMLVRSRCFILWACIEELFGCVLLRVLADGQGLDFVGTVGAAVMGTALGAATSGIVRWPREVHDGHEGAGSKGVGASRGPRGAPGVPGWRPSVVLR